MYGSCLVFNILYLSQLYFYRKRNSYRLSTNRNEVLSSCDDHIRNGDWVVDPVPPKLRVHNVDLGDVSPVNAEHFMTALNSGADGIQVSNKSYINHLLLNLKMYKFMNLK